MPKVYQDVHIRQVDGGFIVRKNTVALDDQTAAAVGQRTDEEVCTSPMLAVAVAAHFLGVQSIDSVSEEPMHTDFAGRYADQEEDTSE